MYRAIEVLFQYLIHPQQVLMEHVQHGCTEITGAQNENRAATSRLLVRRQKWVGAKASKEV